MVVSKTAKTATDLARDLNRVAIEGWPARPFPLAEGAESGSVPIVVKRSVWDAIHQHGRSRTDVEVCGVLVGNVYRGDNGPYVYVEAHIRGHHAGSQLAQVTFTAETWEHLQNTMDREYPQQRIIGWYHTHPGFGIFLSPMDLFIHENFFSAAEQVAIVYDPLSGKEGLFVWQRGEAVVGSFAVEEDLARQPPQLEARSPDRRPAVATQSQDPPAPTGRAAPRRRWVWTGLLLVLLTVIAGVVGLWLLAESPRFRFRRPIHHEAGRNVDRLPIPSHPADPWHDRSPNESDR